ncbi:MAG: radical SAM protein [Patescibacteria group bacterium]
MKLETYRINDEVYLVEGRRRAAVYDLESGSVFSINDSAKRIILEQRKGDQFYSDLVGCGLANPELTPDVSMVDSDQKPHLSFLWCEVTKRCNLKCVHCYNGDIKEHDDFEPNLDGLFKRIYEGLRVGADKIQFIGGEPFTISSILDMAEFAVKSGYSFVEIFTNATKISQKDIYRIKELGLNIAISLYSDVAEIHDKVTQVPGSFSRTRRTMDKLKEAKIPTRVGVVVMRINQDTIGGTLEMIKQFGFEGGDNVDIVRLVGRSSKSLLPKREIITKYGVSLKPSFTTSREEFQNNRKFNPCWGGKVAVRADLAITPCIMDKTLLAESGVPMAECLESEKLESFWGITKDKINGCNGCEYRYACGDCRVVAKAETGSYYGKTSRCSYNPNTGQWC